ncbi:Holliday junction ATP-dependent DNA helicase RuvB, partial [hydrothermal vent metagenome]
FLMRSPRGRVATRRAYLHFGLPAPVKVESDEDLFETE